MGNSNTFTLDVTIGRASFSAAGDSAEVLKAFGDFQELIKKPAEIQLPDGIADDDADQGNSHGNGGGSTATATETNAKGAEEKVPLRVFLDSKKLPRGNSVIGLGIAIWAKRYANVNEIDADSAKSYWRDSGRKIPSNINRDLGSAATEGWLERLPTKGQFSATSYGEKFFDDLETA